MEERVGFLNSGPPPLVSTALRDTGGVVVLLDTGVRVVAGAGLGGG